MNRFLSKKKPVDNSSSSPLPPLPQTSRKWKKSKKEAMEPKPEIVLNTVLPSTDDFRTSLIMPNLSARFSMLREQDDPTSKLGKASDDSVLQPQRSSRLLDFGFSANNLNDIAEVASINSSVQRPFAFDRQSSFASEEGYGTDNDSSQANSIMSRAKPGEGNVLFGGRQKVYKIATATGSVRSVGGASERGLGKVLYEDDVSMSAFQKYRQLERERLVAAGAEFDSDTPLSPDAEFDPHASEDQLKGLGLSHPEPTFRRSDSTTNSIPSQGASSAATSVASQPIGTAITTPAVTTKTSPNPAGPGLERSLTKRRLYEQGLNQHIYDQQASAMTRLNSIQRQRAPTVGTLPSALGHSKSIGNLHERRAYKPYALQRQQSENSRVQNGPPGISALNTFVGKPRSNTSSPIMPSWPQSPISPGIPETEEYQVLSSALEPGDRGKATAMGAFNKPSQRFDEHQYLKRQMQMDHVTSPLASPVYQDESATQTPVHPNEATNQSPVYQNEAINQSLIYQHEATKQTPVYQHEAIKPTPADQDSINKFTTREPSTSRQVSAESTPQDSVLSRFDSARQNSISGASQRSRSGSLSRPPVVEETTNKALAIFQKAANKNRAVHGESPVPPTTETFEGGQRTFFGDIGASDDEDEDVQEQHDSGFEKSSPASYAGRSASSHLPSVSEHPALRNDYISEVDEEEEEKYVGTLPTIEPTILEARNIDTQEIDSPTIGTGEALGGLISQHLRNTSDVSSIYPPGSSSGIFPGSNGPASPYTNSSDQAYSGSNAWDLDELNNYYGDFGSGRPISPMESVASKEQQFAPAPLQTYASPERPSTSHEEGAQWQNELFKKQHNRDASTATQAEREAFDNELAARQKAIQEKMKSLVESESRGPSPGPSAGGALKAFGMLKSRPSHEAMNSKLDLSITNNKPTKMLGLGLTGTQFHDDRISQPANVGSQWPLGPGPVASPMPQADYDSGMRRPSIAPHPALRESSRTRSNSESSRTRSRSRSIRHDVPGVGGIPGMPSVAPPQRPSPEANQFRSPSTEGRGRMRSNSRAAGLHPSARGTPVGPSPAHSPSGFSLSQGSTPRSAMMSPPTGGNNPPAPRPPFQKSSTAPLPSVPLGKPRGEALRKKTINKFDISEPTLVSSTSNIDTVDLPAGASLRNGMEEIYAAQPPPPSISARRRKLFGFGREGSSEDMRGKYAAEGVTSPPTSGITSPPMRPTMASFRSGSQEPRKPFSETGSIYPNTLRSQDSFETQTSNARFDAVGSPVLNDAGMF